jgi:histidyl-tRNA synthetase
MRILDCKSEICQSLVQGAPVMLDYLDEDCQIAFDDLKTDLDAMNVEYTVDPGIVRGLDYYTKTAFEFVSNTIGAQGTVCGGGRYDNLIEELGGPPIPGVGFGLGIERLLLTLEANGVVIPEPEGVDVFIAILGENGKKYGLSLLRELRRQGLRAEVDLLARNFKGQFKYSDRLNSRYTVMIGDNELEEGRLTIKDMSNSEQRTVDINVIMDELVKICKQR